MFTLFSEEVFFIQLNAINIYVYTPFLNNLKYTTTHFEPNLTTKLVQEPHLRQL